MTKKGGADTSFDVHNLTKTVEDIDFETRELDNELATVQKDLELKESKFAELKASNEFLAQKQAKIEGELIFLKVVSKERLANEMKEKTKQLKALTEDIAEAEVELRRQEALGEMWQNRKFDLIEYQRQQLMQIEEKIQNGPLGLRLLDLGKQIKDLTAEENDNSLQKMKEDADKLAKESTSLSDQGKIMEQKSIVMRKEMAKMEKELSKLQSATKLTESRVAAKKIRYSKLNKDE